jgi:AcrR family transcriptional regulator
MTQARPLRADAARNREAILTAAAKLLARDGLDVSLDEVARRAGVGSATVYRRFPTQEALAAAVLEAKITCYANEAEAAAIRAETEPEAAFVGWVHRLAELLVEDRAFGQSLTAPGTRSASFQAEHARAFEASRRLGETARASGVVRPDFHHSDLFLLVQAIDGLLTRSPSTAGEAWPRLAAIFLAGFAAGDKEQLPPVPPVWAGSSS